MVNTKVKGTPKEVTPDVIRQLVDEHFALHPTLRPAQLTTGRTWMSGHMSDIDGVLMQMVNSGRLRRVYRGNQVVFFERDHELLISTYWFHHGAIDHKQLTEMTADYVVRFETPTQRVATAAALRTKNLSSLVRRMAESLKVREDAEACLDIINDLELAVGRATGRMFELGILSVPEESAEKVNEHAAAG